jgi:carbonic anhydrase
MRDSEFVRRHVLVRRIVTIVVLAITPIGGASRVDAQSFEYFGERGPLQWGKLEPGWTACSTGTHQSPIDLSPANAARKFDKLPVSYSLTRGHIFNNGHTIEVETEGRNVLTVGGRSFELVQFHLHTPSEHRVGGRSYEMELHLVHRAEGNDLAVVGVFLTRGGSSKALASIFEALPSAVGRKHQLKSPFNPADFLPARQTYFRYDGSLTTPPCTEGVLWFVLEQPLSVLDEHLARFAKLIPFNARPVQRRGK